MRRAGKAGGPRDGHCATASLHGELGEAARTAAYLAAMQRRLAGDVVPDRL
jgi:hypothetical protein